MDHGDILAFTLQLGHVFSDRVKVCDELILEQILVTSIGPCPFRQGKRVNHLPIVNIILASIGPYPFRQG